MIRRAETTADLERCAAISPAVDPESPVSVETLRGATAGALLLDEPGGYARLHTCGVAHRLEHGMTAVRRSHRRRAADHGYRELRTDTVEGNVGRRVVNERLGYRPLRPVVIVSGAA